VIFRFRSFCISTSLVSYAVTLDFKHLNLEIFAIAGDSEEDKPKKKRGQEKAQKPKPRKQEVNLDYSKKKTIPGLNIHLGNQNYVRLGDYQGNTYINIEKRDPNGNRKSGVTLPLDFIETLKAAVQAVKDHITANALNN